MTFRVDNPYTICSNKNVSRYTTVVLTHDLIGKWIPGDIVQIAGFVKNRWRQLKKGEICQVELFVEANNVELVKSNLSIITDNTMLNVNQYEEFRRAYNNDMIARRNKIVKYFAPNLIGIDNAKLAVLLSVVGGVDNDKKERTETNSKWDKYGVNDKSQSKIIKKYLNENIYDGKRTNCHILLLGDSGTGKSQLLKAALELSNKSVMVSGSNCTSAGLTCSVLREGSETLLAAGALVLANGGICCIDEFSLIKQHDATALHEAMEQQTISVAKAGATLSIPCQCTIIASSNFKAKKGTFLGNTSENGDVEDCMLDTDLPISLLTRFDLVILFTNENDDDMVDFLLSLNKTSDILAENTTVNAAPFSLGWVKGYLEWVREKIKPKVTIEAKKVLLNYYTELRKSCYSDNDGVTIRILESLLRLSQAHARLLYRDTVEVFDAGMEDMT